MERREFLRWALVAPLGFGRARARARARSAWRTYEVRVRLRILGPTGSTVTRAWIPLPLERAARYQRELGHEWSGNASRCRAVEDPASEASIFCAEWTPSETSPEVELVLRVSTRDVDVAFDGPGLRPASGEDLSRYLEPTALIPTDGIVAETARRIVGDRSSDLSKARAIYDWIVENTFRDPKVRGCGTGDIRWMLETGNLGGKCADLNALFVGLARASGLPARDVYGIRVGPSSRFPSLGLASGGDATSAQHCRAEVHLRGVGWVPVDPADVRKVMLEERPDVLGNAADPYFAEVRERLFGTWEMNWIAFNDAHDVALPGSSGERIGFFMYPEAEVDGRRKDSLDAGRFEYRITASAIDP